MQVTESMERSDFESKYESQPDLLGLSYSYLVTSKQMIGTLSTKPTMVRSIVND